MVAVLFIVFVVALAIGVPVAFSLGLASVAYMLGSHIQMINFAQYFFKGLDSFTLLCIPGFTFAGNLMNQGGISDKLLDFADALVGHITGGLAYANVLASMVFAGISGTALSDTVALGGVEIPMMVNQGYDVPFSVAITAASSCLGPIIPPSITLIVYASITNVSVSKLFIGSVIPGLLLVVCLMGYALVYAKRNNLPAHEKMPAKEVAKTFKSSIWALLMPIIILGGIFGGIFTATEAAAVAVVYALIVSLFIYKDTKWSELPASFVEASVSTATIMVMVGLSKASSYVVVTSGLPALLLDTFSSLTESRVLILLLLNLLFLIIGMLMEANAAIIMMTPILMPLLTLYGINPLMFGIVMSFNLCIGLVTPPVGLCLLLSNQIGETSLSKSLKALMPLLLISIVVLLLITYVDPLTTWLPSLLKK